MDRNDLDKCKIAIGSHIVNLRKMKNLTQEELAFLSNLPVRTLSKIETGQANFTIKTIYEVCKGLDISFEELFQGCDLNESISLGDFEKQINILLSRLSLQQANVCLDLIRVYIKSVK